MSGITDHSSLVSLWSVHRNAVLALGQELHHLLSDVPPGEPPLTLAGRDLRPATEGVGFQLQYTLSDVPVEGTIRSAWYVVQVQLEKRSTSVGWLIEAMPVLAGEGGSYDLYRARPARLPLGDRAGVRAHFIGSLAEDARNFFGCVRDGARPAEEALPVDMTRAVEMPASRSSRRLVSL